MKKLLLGVMVCAICISATVATHSAHVAAPNLQQPAATKTTVTIQDTISVTKIDKSTVASNFGINVENLGSKPENYYQDSHKNVYMMDSQNRLTTFWEGSSKANNKISSSDSQKIDPVDLLQNAIKNTVPNSDNFIVDKNSFTRGCYHILMLRKVDQDVSDSITA